MTNWNKSFTLYPVARLLVTDHLSRRSEGFCMEDAELVRLCQDGDISAFEQLFYRYQERMYNIAYRMTNNREDALDLTQEIFLKAYQKINGFKFRSAFSTWLYRLALNLCIDELRKRRSASKTTVSSDDLNFSTGVSSPIRADRVTPEDNVISKEYERQIWDAINSLREKDRTIIILRDMEGLSYEEISRILECSPGRVKSRLHEARQKLKSILKTRGGFDEFIGA